MKRTHHIQTIHICYGSDTGNTERAAYWIAKALEKLGFTVTLQDIVRQDLEQLLRYDALIFGLSTWYYGEPQADWEDQLPALREMALPQLVGKPVAIFGCGDQQDYADHFCDAMGWLVKEMEPYQVQFAGAWPTKGYQFRRSQALLTSEQFFGLALDMDRQADLTERRIAQWTEQLRRTWSTT